MQTLFDSLLEVQRDAVALLCGFETCAAFRSQLRAMPAMPNATLGEIARAVLHARLDYLDAVALDTAAA